MWLLLLFVAVPLIEIALFIKVGGWLTLWPTLGIVLLTGIIGTILVRHQGLRVLNDLRRSQEEFGNPLSPLAHGALILLAGVLLLTPGFFTDTVGFLLLVPKIRDVVIARLASRISIVGFPGQRDEAAVHHGTTTIIDAEYFEMEDDAGIGAGGASPPRPPGRSGWTRH